MKKKNGKPNGKKSRLRLLHQYYSYTGFYRFVWGSIKKAAIPVFAFFVILFVLDRYVIDMQEILIRITETYSPVGILSVFFASESLLGLVPPELFIAWTGKSAHPFLFLTALAVASYLGGIISYYIGRAITKIPSVHRQVEIKMAQHIENARKWGGFLIIVGALLPVPFAMSSIAAGIIKFRFTSYLLFGLLRFARFYLYALLIYNIV